MSQGVRIVNFILRQSLRTIDGTPRLAARNNGTAGTESWFPLRALYIHFEGACHKWEAIGGYLWVGIALVRPIVAGCRSTRVSRRDLLDGAGSTPPLGASANEVEQLAW